MERKECEVCTKVVREKYKHYRMWKTLAIVFICISVVLSVLYFASGDMFVEEDVENNVRIENGEGSNQNSVITGDGSTISGTVRTESNIGVIIIVSVLILSGGIVYGSYLISKKKGEK